MFVKSARQIGNGATTLAKQRWRSTTETHFQGITLVELLVVMAVISILAALLLPAVQAAREAARRTSCRNNLKQLGLALQLYHDVYKTFPPGTMGDDAIKYGGDFNQAFRGFGWGACILPFLEEAPLHQKIDFNLPFMGVPATASNANEDLLTTVALPKFLCPSDPRAPKDPTFWQAPNMSASSYIGNYGVNGYLVAPGGSQNVSWTDTRFWGGFVNSVAPLSLANSQGVGPMFNNSRTGISDITDGLSNTILLGERRGDLTMSISPTFPVTPGQTFWAGYRHHHLLGSAYYRPNKCGPDTPPIKTNECIGTFSSLHRGGLQVCLADGSVRFISDAIDSADETTLDALADIKNPGAAYRVWQALCDIRDGMPVGEF